MFSLTDWLDQGDPDRSVGQRVGPAESDEGLAHPTATRRGERRGGTPGEAHPNEFDLTTWLETRTSAPAGATPPETAGPQGWRSSFRMGHPISLSTLAGVGIAGLAAAVFMAAGLGVFGPVGGGAPSSSVGAAPGDPPPTPTVDRAPASTPTPTPPPTSTPPAPPNSTVTPSNRPASGAPSAESQTSTATDSPEVGDELGVGIDDILGSVAQ